MVRYFFDIETLPPDEGDPLIAKRFGPLPDEDFRNLALNPKYGRLLCIGLIIEKDGEIIQQGVLGRNRSDLRFHLDEAKTLRAFWNLVKNFNPYRDLFVGHNILDFDLHFICQKSIIKRVKPTIDISFIRYRKAPVFDIIWQFENWRRRVSLDEQAIVLGIESSKRLDASGQRIDGTRIYDLFLEDRHEEIAEYCMADTRVTREIYYRINFIEQG